MTDAFYFKIKYDPEKAAGEFKVGIYGNMNPLALENLKFLCSNGANSPQPVRYPYDSYSSEYVSIVGSELHYVVKGYGIYTGSFAESDGLKRGHSKYGMTFRDEQHILKHDAKYLMSLVNYGKPNTNQSMFMFTLAESMPWLDSRQVVIGKVVDGEDILDTIE